MHIEISNTEDGDFEVRVVESDGHVLHRYTYRTIESARRAAAAWTAAYDNCWIKDNTEKGGKS
jgi:hypothetical protein